MTMQDGLDARRDARSRASTSESFYDKRSGLVRVISRSDGKVVGDYTTAAAEDEFSFFPGLLEGAAFYKQALANGDARIVGQGSLGRNPVYWVELEKGGGLILRIGIGRDSYRPVVFRALNPDGSFAGVQVGDPRFRLRLRTLRQPSTTQPLSSSTGRVFGPDCRPAKARVDAFLAGDADPVDSGAEVAVGPDAARTGPSS